MRSHSMAVVWMLIMLLVFMFWFTVGYSAYALWAE